MSNRPKLIGIIGHQRGGTTVFRAMLGSMPSAVDLGEIFSGHVEFKSNFWNFLGLQYSSKPELLCPHFWHDAWERYIFAMSQYFKARVLVFDLKIDVLPYVFMDVPYSRPHTSQFFFSWEQLKLIRIRRRNTLALVVSKALAEKTNEWGVENEAVGERLLFHARRHEREANTQFYTNMHFSDNVIDWEPEGKITLNASDLYQKIRAIQAGDKFASLALKGMKPLQLAYENMFDNKGDFRLRLIASIAKFIDVDPSLIDPKPILKKQGYTNFLDRVVNQSEIREYFSKTEYAWMLPRDEVTV